MMRIDVITVFGLTILCAWGMANAHRHESPHPWRSFFLWTLLWFAVCSWPIIDEMHRRATTAEWQCLIEGRSANGVYRLIAPVSSKVPQRDGCWHYSEMPALGMPDNYSEESDQNDASLSADIAEVEAI